MAFYASLTDIGLEKITELLTGNTLTLTEVAVGSTGNIGASSTGLQTEEWRGTPERVAVSATDPNIIQIDIAIPEDIGGFIIKDGGIFSNEGDMLAFFLFGDGIPKYIAGSGLTSVLRLKVLIHVGTTASDVITLSVDPQSGASKQYVDDAIAALDNSAVGLENVTNDVQLKESNLIQEVTAEADKIPSSVAVKNAVESIAVITKKNKVSVLESHEFPAIQSDFSPEKITSLYQYKDELYVSTVREENIGEYTTKFYYKNENGWHYADMIGETSIPSEIDGSINILIEFNDILFCFGYWKYDVTPPKGRFIQRLKQKGYWNNLEYWTWYSNQKLNGWVSAAIVYKDNLYINTNDNDYLLVFNKDYNNIWNKVDSYAYAYGKPKCFCEYRGKLYVGTMHHVYSWDGENAWEESYEILNNTFSSMCVFNDTLYAFTRWNEDCRIAMFDGSSWSIIYTLPENCSSTLICYKDLMFVVSISSGKMLIFDGISWTAEQIFPAETDIDSSVEYFIYDDTLYITINNILYKLNSFNNSTYIQANISLLTAVPLSLKAGWNLISIPVVPLNSFFKISELFPDATVYEAVSTINTPSSMNDSMIGGGFKTYLMGDSQLFSGTLIVNGVTLSFNNLSWAAIATGINDLVINVTAEVIESDGMSYIRAVGEITSWNTDGLNPRLDGNIYEKTYNVTEKLFPEKGYWVQVPYDRTYIALGKPLTGYRYDVPATGWYLLGSINFPVTKDSISPSVDVVYEYEDGRYQEVTTLLPGKGYWVQITSEHAILRVGNII
ncbi:hypothetical protein GMMP15_840003 [Candidatus Magnetomoraceae bacterium gMMP-15]